MTRSKEGTSSLIILFCLAGCNETPVAHQVQDSGTLARDPDSGSSDAGFPDSGPLCTVDPPSGCEASLDTCSTNLCDPVLLQCVRQAEADDVACSVVASGDPGVCADGACCTGCLIGSSCKEGTHVPWCGAAGSQCEPCCTDPGCTCTDGHCSPTMDALGSAQACSIRNGHLYCWGDNISGQLGIGNGTPQAQPTLVDLDDVVNVGVGEGHACALVRSADVYCWGRNVEGQLGIDGDPTVKRTPQKITSVPKSIFIATGVSSTCAITLDGEVYCWGNNQLGILGRVTAQPTSPIPLPVPGVTDAVQVSLGDGHACAVRANGEVMCWGLNRSRQLGDDTTNDGPARTVLNLTTAIQVVAGISHSCALLRNGTVYCWGSSRLGEGGNGLGGTTGIPTLVNNLTDAVEIASYKNHVCAITSTNEVHCWGSNSYSQLGGAGVTGSHIVISGLNPVAIGAGFNFSCARDTSGALLCWGINSHGELGDGTTGAARSTPMPVLFPQ